MLRNFIIVERDVVFFFFYIRHPLSYHHQNEISKLYEILTKFIIYLVYTKLIKKK